MVTNAAAAKDALCSWNCSSKKFLNSWTTNSTSRVSLTPVTISPALPAKLSTGPIELSNCLRLEAKWYHRTHWFNMLLTSQWVVAKVATAFFRRNSDLMDGIYKSVCCFWQNCATMLLQLSLVSLQPYSNKLMEPSWTSAWTLTILEDNAWRRRRLCYGNVLGSATTWTLTKLRRRLDPRLMIISCYFTLCSTTSFFLVTKPSHSSSMSQLEK